MGSGQVSVMSESLSKEEPSKITPQTALSHKWATQIIQISNSRGALMQEKPAAPALQFTGWKSMVTLTENFPCPWRPARTFARGKQTFTRQSELISECHFCPIPLCSDWLSPLLGFVTWLDGDDKAKISSELNLRFYLQKMNHHGWHHAIDPKLTELIQNYQAGTALWEDSRSLFCTMKHINREASQMVAQQQKISEINFLPWEVLDWQLWKQTFCLSTGQDRKNV